MRHGNVYYTRQERNGKQIIHKIAVTPVIPHGWMIYIDDKPGYGERIMKYKEVLEHLIVIKRMLENMNNRVPGSGVWLVDSEQEVAPIVPPRNSIPLEGDEDMDDSNVLPMHYQQQQVKKDKTEEAPTKVRPLNKPKENKEEK